MEVTITARHCTVSDTVRERTQRRMGRLERFHPRAKSTSVTFAEDRGRKTCEAKILVDGGPPLFASFTDTTFRGAVDGATEKLERQLKRQRERRRRRNVNVARTS